MLRTWTYRRIHRHTQTPTPEDGPVDFAYSEARGRGMPRLLPFAALALCTVLSLSCSPTASRPTARDSVSASYLERQAPRNPSGCLHTLVGVAHPDDDLYFTDPDISRMIRAGCPMTTMYLTGGDDGKRRRAARDYVGRREDGVKAAYAELAGVPDRWTEETLRVNGRGIRSLRLDNSRVRLAFLGLHDGLPGGQSPESMLRLFLEERKQIQVFQGSESYTEQQLLKTLSEFARQERVEQILTMDYDNASFAFSLNGRLDHADHGIGARYFRTAGYISGIPVRSYLGYTMSRLKPNLDTGQVREKEASVRRYLAKVLCGPTDADCDNAEVHSGRLPRDDADWVHRQYEQVHRNPRPGEIMGDIGRTTEFTGREPEQCLAAVRAAAEDGAVRIESCDGSQGQKWDFGSDGTIRSRLYAGHCLTKITDSAGLARCEAADTGQKWSRKPWSSPAWKRKAWLIAGEGNACLHQDDRSLPSRWNAKDHQHPKLGFIGCDAQIQPGLYWRWQG
ncbi:ricin-type beta-trefoil lectin domain protein [Streptomyces brevispora]|nr:ricin-type beta-trefoil lectin domain protein [Streptomyces brevispora]